MAADLVTRLLLETKMFDDNIKKSANQIASFENNIKVAGSSVTSFIGKFGAMTGIGMGLSDIVNTTMKFEKSLSSLRAITGLTAEEMVFFQKEAIKMSGTSTKSASEIVEAFQLIGSARAELLKNKEALVEVTNQAVILSEAAGIDVPTAAKALTGSLGQMGVSSSKASEFVNILAAAAQEGSAEIDYLNTAIEKSGGAASSVGIDFVDLVSAIEAIAPKITEASVAGTNLRNIFLTLESSSDKKLKPSVVGLGGAIEELAKRQMSVTQLTGLFGKETITAALALISAKDQYNYYTEAIVGTNSAIEQQVINNNNVAGSIKSVASAWESLILKMNKSSGFLATTMNGVGAFLRDIASLADTADDKKAEIIEKKANSILNKVKGSVDANKAGGITNEKSIQLAKNEYDSNYGYLVDKYKSDIVSLTLSLKNKERELNSSNKNNGPLSSRSIALADEIKLLKQSIALTNEKISIQKKADEFVSNYFSESSSDISSGDSKSNNDATTKTKVKPSYVIQDLDQKNIDGIRKELQEKLGKIGDAPLELAMPIKYVESEEQSDIKGSISDKESQLQALYIAYNEATNADLRKIYAQRISDLENSIDKMHSSAKNGMVDLADSINNLIENSIIVSFQSLGDALGSGDFGEGMKAGLMSLMGLLEQFGSALIATGIASLALKSVLANPIAAIVAGSALLIAAAAAKAAISSAQDFADGGIVYGETFARVGEYAGANTNPEVIAPLNKLKDILGDRSGGGELRLAGEFKIRGKDLVYIIDKQTRYNSRT